jgi:hypothetical protein
LDIYDLSIVSRISYDCSRKSFNPESEVNDHIRSMLD